MDNSTRNGLKWTSVQLSKFQCHYPLNQLSSFGFRATWKLLAKGCEPRRHWPMLGFRDYFNYSRPMG